MHASDVANKFCSLAWDGHLDELEKLLCTYPVVLNTQNGRGQMALVCIAFRVRVVLLAVSIVQHDKDT